MELLNNKDNTMIKIINNIALGVMLTTALQLLIVISGVHNDVIQLLVSLSVILYASTHK